MRILLFANKKKRCSKIKRIRAKDSSHQEVKNFMESPNGRIAKLVSQPFIDSTFQSSNCFFGESVDSVSKIGIQSLNN